MITSYNIVVSMRKYLIDKYGLKTVIKTMGWKVPKERPFYSVSSPTTNHLTLAKNKELIHGVVLVEVGCYADSLVELNEITTNVKSDILYSTIPLLSDSGEVIGAFSFSEIVGDTEITDDDTQPVQNETVRNRRYIEARASIAMVKEY